MQGIEETSNHQPNSREPMEMIQGRQSIQQVEQVISLTICNTNYEAFIIAMGELYPCPKLVEAILAPIDGGSPKQVLDAGCGTGFWAFEMASRFPHAQVKGIDMSPLQIPSSCPSNFSFEIQDLNTELSRYHGQFHLIHVKNLMGGIKDAEKTVKELELCLRPGGLLIVIEGDYFVGEDKEQYVKMAKLDGETASAVDENGSWLNRMIMELIHGSVISGARKCPINEVLDLGPWDHDLCDPDWSASGSIYIPAGPWAKGSTLEETQRLERAGNIIKGSLTKFNKAIQASLMSYGLEKATLDEWSRNADEEVLGMKHKMWLRKSFFWTRRRQGEGPLVPPLPNRATDQSTILAHGVWPHHPTTVEIYYNKEETLARMEKRHESLHDLPILAVEKAWQEKQTRERAQRSAI